LGKLEGRQVDGTSEFVGSVFQKQEEEFFSGAKVSRGSKTTFRFETRGR
jgi:hypothetical protein